MNGFKNGSEIGDAEEFTFGGGVGDFISVFTLRVCTTVYTLGSGAGGWVLIDGDEY